jgi:hypothetical protein
MRARLIEFRTDSRVLGTVTIQDGVAVVEGPGSRSLHTIVDAYRHRSGSLDGFGKFYADWSNGYVSSREVDDAPDR